MSKPPLQSRLEYYCLSCLRTGPRSESYRELKKQTPGFTDTCAYCQSDDVEVFDPKVSMPSELVN